MRRGQLMSTMLAAMLGALVATDSSAQGAGNIQGAWAVVSAEQDARPATDVMEHRLTFSGDTFTIRRSDHILYQGTYLTDPGRKPAQIDFRHTEGTLKGKTWKGIYRLEGETLTICDNAPDMTRPRPARFATRAGSGAICLVFKRATG
jgi:uncharacterized protein (TIGR03067 family)